MKQTDNILLVVFFLLLEIFLGLVLLRRDRLTPPVVLEYKSSNKRIILKGANNKRKFLEGERAKLIWYEHQVGDTLRMEELR